jgi:predicted RNA-binding protein YlqC (UPF0109 family)
MKIQQVKDGHWERAEKLWQLLDDIDTLDDACRADDRQFRDRVRSVQQKRFGILTSDGYELYVPDEPMTPTNQAANQEATTIDEKMLLLSMVQAVVRQPEKVAISTTRGRDVSVLTISVDPQDISHVIGKEHRTIQALTHLIAKSAAMVGRRVLVNLDIQNDPEV